MRKLLGDEKSKNLKAPTNIWAVSLAALLLIVQILFTMAYVAVRASTHDEDKILVGVGGYLFVSETAEIAFCMSIAIIIILAHD